MPIEMHGVQAMQAVPRLSGHEDESLVAQPGGNPVGAKQRGEQVALGVAVIAG